MLVPGAWWEIWLFGSRRPCCFPGHGERFCPGPDASHVGFRGMAGAVCLGLPPAMLVRRAWRELLAWVCQAVLVFPGDGKSCRPGATGRPCWFPGHGGICGHGAAASHVGSQGMAGAVGLKLLGGHVGSWGMAGAVGPGLPPAMLVPQAWRDLWARVCQAVMVFLGPGKSCGPGAAGRPCSFPGHGGSTGLGAAGRP